MPLDAATRQRNRDEIAALSDEITTLSAHLHAATYRLLVLIEAFDRRGGWGEWGVLSCAHWLSWKCGLDLGAAREKVRVARCLPHLPLISESFRKGEVSYSKVRAMTRVATPENEDYLLMIARHGTASHVERLVRGFRKVLRTMERERANEIHEARGVQAWWDDDGMLVVNARLAPEQGAVLLEALGAASEARWRAGEAERPPHARGPDARVSAGAPADDGPAPGVTAEVEGHPRPVRETHAARRADALAALAESFLDHGLSGAGTADRHQVVVHVSGPVSAPGPAPDASSPVPVSDTGSPTREVTPGAAGEGKKCLAPGRVTPGGFDTAALDHGPPLAEDTARRIACDASLVRLTASRRGEPLDVGRKTRTVPPSIRRALQHRDGGCRFPGCTNHRHVDAHHITHWADGGETSMDNLVLLCRRHHRLVHEGGFTLRAAGGARHVVFARPNGEQISPVPPPLPPPVFDVEHLVESNRIAALEIDERTCLPIGDEYGMDESMAVEGALQASGYSFVVDPPRLRDGATVPGSIGLRS